MFGRWDAEEFMEEITADQFDRWKAFAEVEPFGPWADDQRNGLAIAMGARFHRYAKSKNEPFTASDFMICRTKKQAAKKLPLKVMREQMEAALGKPNG